MRRAVVGIWDLPLAGETPALAVLSVSFFLGGIAGCLLAAGVDGGGSESLASYLGGFLTLVRTNGVTPPPILPLLWEVLRWPLLTVLLGFTALGVVGLPILFMARGFLLSFAIASFSCMFGTSGSLMSAAVFGVSGLFSIPALFILGVQGFVIARGFAGRGPGDGGRRAPLGKACFLRCGLCAGALCVCILLEYFAVPALLSGMAGLFPA